MLSSIFVPENHNYTFYVLTKLSQLQKLYNVRIGPGAAVLPKDITRIHLDFAFKFNDGHFGARKMWRNYLPRLKYHNPAVSMTVYRSQDQASPATLTIYYGSPASPATAASSSTPNSSSMNTFSSSNHTSFERVKTIDMKHRHESDILAELMDLTKAAPVTATPEEEAELHKLADEEKHSAIDRERNKAYNEQKRQEKALLDQARGGFRLA
ncbi:MAG: hypothetical protein Q9219_006694 [cf. Caloplaca sp. 3 TL-2023]